MLDRSPSLCRRCILAVAFIAATGGVTSVGRTQQVAGSLGASLTILAPSAAPPRVTGFDVGRDGVVRIEATLPDSPGARRDDARDGRMHWLVMARVVSSAAAFTRDARPPTSLAPSSGEQRLLHVLQLRRIPRALDAHPVELRVEYLIVAGT